MTQQKLVESIKRLGSCFQTIDCRIVAALNEEKRWMNILSVIRLRHEPAEVIGQEMQDRLREYGPVVTEHFQIIMSAVRFLDWDSFVASCEEGRVMAGNVPIHFKVRPQLAGAGAYIFNHQGFVTSKDQPLFPALEFTIGQGEPQVLYNPTIEQELSDEGFMNPYEAIGALCDVNVQYGTNLTMDMVVHVPVLATISEIKFDRTNRAMADVLVTHHRAINEMGHGCGTEGGE